MDLPAKYTCDILPPKEHKLQISPQLRSTWYQLRRVNRQTHPIGPRNLESKEIATGPHVAFARLEWQDFMQSKAATIILVHKGVTSNSCHRIDVTWTAERSGDNNRKT